MQSAEGYSGVFDQGQDSQKHAAVVTTLINAFLIVKNCVFLFTLLILYRRRWK